MGYAVEHLLVGPQFDPEVGFVRRLDFRRNYGQLQFNPRPTNSTRVRRYSLTGTVDYVTSADAVLPRSFVINPGTIVPKGGYNYRNLRSSYSLGQQRMISGLVSGGYGTLYGGHRTEAGYGGRLALLPQFAVEPSVSLNWVRLPYGNFSAPVAGMGVQRRAEYRDRRLS